MPVLTLGVITAASLAANLVLIKQCRKLNDIAYTDILTSCRNKAAFIKRKTSNTSMYVVLDVCFLKLHNDVGGHVEGDKYLAEVGALLKGITRKGEITYRTGGDEFVITANMNLSDAKTLTDRIDAALEAYRLQGRHSARTPVELAYGVGNTVESADLAMYTHKKTIHARYNYTR